MMEWHVLPKERCQSLATVVLCVLLLCGGPLLALDGGVPPSAARHEIIPLEQITPERGKELLARLKIGTASRLPGTNALIVTGDAAELQKATALLQLVDTRTEFDVRQLSLASPALPSGAEISQAVGGICVGTFANPPKDKTKMRAIVDVHDGHVVVVAPVMQLQDIRIAVELGPAVLRQRKTVTPPANTSSVPTIAAAMMLESSLNATAGQPVDSGKPEGGEAPAGQPDANGVEPLVPAGLQSAGAAPDQNTPAGVLPVPAAAEPAAAAQAGLQPGQTVPVDSNRITAPKIEPKSITDRGEVKAAAETKSPALSCASLYEPADLPDGDEVLNLNLPERLPVIDLLDLVGKHLGLSYLYDPQKVVGEVTLKLSGELRGKVRKRDLYPLLEATLQEKDLVMTRHKGNVIRIMPKTEATQKADPELVTPGGAAIQAGNAVITRVFELKHIDNASADNLLQGMGLTVGVTSIPESRTMIVTAYAHRMARIEQLLELVDRPGAPRKFRYRQLRYTMAKTLAEKVKALAEQLENVTVTIGIPDLPAAATAQQPGESDVAYRTRLAQIRAAQTAQRAQMAAARGQLPQEPKPGVYLDADERTNRILMIGEERQLVTVEELVDALDIAQQELRALQLYRIKHVDAEEVARKLQELGIIHRMPETAASQRFGQQGSRITGGQPTPTPTQPRVTQPGTPENAPPAGTELTEEGLVSEPQVVVVESNNSLLVNGTPEQHAKIASIIEYVDSEMDLEEIPYKIYPLENSSPEHLATILQGLIQETEEQNKDGKIEKVVTKKQQEITIVPDPNTYSLIVYASKKNQEWIQTLVRQLDKRRPQVLIDVTLVEVTKTEAFNYDLNLIENWPTLANADAISTATGGAIKALTKPSDLDAAGTDHFVGAAAKSGRFTGYYADRHINALLTAMQSKNYGRVLAKPKILVNDNEPGDIKTADITYVRKTSSVPFQSATAGQPSTSVQTSVDYEPYDAGIELNITPHISEGDLLRLDVLLTRSDFRPTEDEEAPPNTTTSEVKTAVTVPDGSTIILGGMVKLNQNKGGAKVPILGDLPLVGGLFRSINNSDIQSKLYVFVKAEIIRPEGEPALGMKDLTEISDKNRMAFEKSEMEFQKYQDWPGIEPKPVDPPKVLETR